MISRIHSDYWKLGAMRKTLGRFGVITGWLLIAYGVLVVAANLPVLYMVITGQVKPGERFYVDELTPSLDALLLSVGKGIAALAAGFVVKLVSAKYSNTVAPNNALMTDTSTSPLRAQHGAAKRER